MIAELVELGKRIRKGHDALKEEKCSWYIVINKYVNPAKRNVMVVKNEMRLLKQKRNVLQI